MFEPSRNRFRCHVIILAAWGMGVLLWGLARGGGLDEVDSLKGAEDSEMKQIVITIVYDNYLFDDRLESAWGFSCVVEGLPDTILFDTGGRGDVLLSNMSKLGMDCRQIDKVVLSHIHGDHTGGLAAFLRKNHRVEIYLPHVFPADFKNSIREAGASVVECKQPTKVCEGAWTTGVLGDGLREQGLYFRTSNGLVVVTGCAHPGIVQMAEAAKRHGAVSVYAVLGGFHMSGASRREIETVIRGLRNVGVKKVAPCHCSGDQTRQFMESAFAGYLPAGVGARFAFPSGPKETR